MSTEVLPITLARSRRQAFLLMEWLADHPDPVKPEDLLPQLVALLRLALAPRQKLHLLESLFACLPGGAGLDASIARFVGTRIPLAGAAYRQVQTLLNLVDDFTQGFEQVSRDLPTNAGGDEIGLCLERIAFFLYKHLCASYLVGRRPSIGIWQRLHHVCLQSRQVAQNAPLTHYVKALLLSCAQPASLNSSELAATVYYLQAREAGNLPLTETPPEDVEAAFWIPMQEDLRPFPLVRRQPPPGASVLYFSCATLMERARADLAALEAGATSACPLPLDPRNSRNLLRHLVLCWGHPKLRRFPRARKSCRGALCAGLQNLHAVTRRPPSRSNESAVSHWMITNESPEGYALMFLRGDPGDVAVGNVVALQPDIWVSKVARPLVGLIRWATSETTEHLEIGVQVLATNACAAVLTPAGIPGGEIPALLLPKGAMRDGPALIVSAGAIPDDARDSMLATDGEPPRPVRLTTLREQNRFVEIFSFSEHVRAS
ncbi:MAG: hypothetical protein LBO79_00010 [Zoogloeaceae bacterium]|jgi:hypothetical protein|nr:hypothetical protein [Zoogloeaceae bacterium]